MNSSTIEAILKQAAQEKWPYPQVFDALSAAGVTHYEVDVPQHVITYGGQGFVWKVPRPVGWAVPVVGRSLDADAFRIALTRSQRGQITYAVFLTEIAQAGCTHYRVDMTARSVTYTDNQGTQIVEPVPPSK